MDKTLALSAALILSLSFHSVSPEENAGLVKIKASFSPIDFAIDRAMDQCL